MGIFCWCLFLGFGWGCFGLFCLLLVFWFVLFWVFFSACINVFIFTAIDQGLEGITRPDCPHPASLGTIRPWLCPYSPFTPPRSHQSVPQWAGTVSSPQPCQAGHTKLSQPSFAPLLLPGQLWPIPSAGPTLVLCVPIPALSWGRGKDSGCPAMS